MSDSGFELTHPTRNAGIRILELRLAGPSGTAKQYGVSFRTVDGLSWRSLSVIAGESQTGKTSVADFIRYCLGNDHHPQHHEILASVRSALLAIELQGVATTIERSAVGEPSKFASIWEADFDNLQGATETRRPTSPPSDPLSLSQYVLTACDLDNVALPEAPSKEQSSTQLLSIKDLFRVMWLPNERLDNKNLVFEHANYMITQKFRQLIDVMFGVHDASGTDLAARLKSANEAARVARRDAASLKEIVSEEHPVGPLVLETDLHRAGTLSSVLATRLARMDADQTGAQEATEWIRRELMTERETARLAELRVRDRESLLERLTALRAQYADDTKKLTFLREAEKVFDPLHVQTCPACFTRLTSEPLIQQGACSLCGAEVAQAQIGLGDQVARTGEEVGSTDQGESRGAMALVSAELRSTERRLAELTDYWLRLESDLRLLRTARDAANHSVEEAAEALNRAVHLPAPYLEARDELARRRGDVQLAIQGMASGLRLWNRVAKAEAEADRLAGHAARLREERRDAVGRPDRAAVVGLLSKRFGEILSDFGYPKLDRPMLNADLIPSVRGLSYENASSGGLVLISLAWHLAIWEVSYEDGAAAPGLLIIDSPQKNLGHSARGDDHEFSDARLVDNFYAHVKKWLRGKGTGAQVIIIDNSPPSSVQSDVVVRYTRDRNVPPYGLIDDATD